MKNFTSVGQKAWLTLIAILVLGGFASQTNFLESSSHREAPIIANDPQADNTDLYAFRNPTDPSRLVIIANYIPFQLPQGGPNYYFFGDDVAYDIHIKNDPNTKGDDILYRFMFKTVNEDPTTFFNIRLGKQNLKQTYTLTRSTDGGKSFSTVISNGTVPPYYAGERSIDTPVGLNSSYHQESLIDGIERASTGEKVFVGPVDDPFFIDIGAFFDLGNLRPGAAIDGLRCHNVHTISLNIPISRVQKDGKHPDQAKNILDSDFVLGIWASASRPKITVREAKGMMKHEGPMVQVSRLGMPLTNEVIIPIGRKDEWNSLTPYNESKDMEKYFTNPEIALYIDNTAFGDAVPQLGKLPLQTNSLGMFDFRNGKDGLFPLLNSPAVKGTALDPKLFGNYLLRKGAPRSVDILPIFMTGVPNIAPYQLATGKGGNPLAKGKPFINNFLPIFGDMLRINVSTPVTPRDSPDFSRLGLVQAAVLGLTDPRFNTNADFQNIPNMDGFPNGRRLEDDVVDIETMAVSGVVLAAIGLWYDDYTPGSPNPVTPDLLTVLSAGDGIEKNDVPFLGGFPFQAQPWSALSGNACDCGTDGTMGMQSINSMNLGLAPTGIVLEEVKTYPNPASDRTTIRYNLINETAVSLRVFDTAGRLVATPLQNKTMKAGVHEVSLDVSKLVDGIYYATMQNREGKSQTVKIVVAK
ncbi:T9SS type A sorting domain-containing protein [Pontibacter sp. CAU 1760]